MKKRSSLQKKREATRRKKRLKQLKRLSVKQRLARMAKEKRALADLIAALNQFPPSMTGAVEPEPEEHPHLLKLGSSLLNVMLNRPEYPQRFGRQQPPVQQKLSVPASVSSSQRLTAPLWAEATRAPRAHASLWEAPGQWDWPLTRVGGWMALPASTPRVLTLTHAGGLLLSDATPSALFVVASPTFSCAITLNQPAENRWHQEELLLPPPSLSSGHPALRWSGSYRTAPAAMVDSDLRAGNPLEVEQAAPNNKNKRRSRRIFVFEKQLCKAVRSCRATKRLRKAGNRIRKSSRFDKKFSFQQRLSGAKNRRDLDQPGGSILRILGWSQAADTGLWMKRVKLLGRKQRGVFHGCSRRRVDWQRWLKESQAASSTDSHRQLFTLIPPAAVPRKSKHPAENRLHQEQLPIPPLSSGHPARRWKGSYRTAPAAAVNPDLQADNPLEAEQASSNDIKGDIGHERFIFEKHPQEARSCRVTKRLRKTAGFIRKSPRPDKKFSLQGGLNRAKDQEHLGQHGSSIFRLRGWSRAADTGLGRKPIKLLGRKHLGSFHWPSIRRSDGQRWLRENRSASSTDSHRPLITLIPPAAVPGSRPPSVQLSPTGVVNPELIAENLLGAERLSSNDIKGNIEHERFVFKIHLREFRPRQATEDTSDEDDELGVEQDAFYDEKENTGKTLFEVEELSPEARQIASCPSCCIDSLLQGDYPYPIPEGKSAEQLVERFRLLEAMSAALQYDHGCDVHREISDRISPTLLWRFPPVVFIQ